MNKLRRLAATLLALGLAAGCSTQPSERESEQSVVEQRSANAAAEQAYVEEQRERLVLAFGDSLYAGFGIAQSHSFPAALERALDKRGIDTRVVNAGIPGDTTHGGRQRLEATLDALPATPDLVILGLGANDALLGLPPEEMRSNLEAMLRQLDRRGIPVLLTSLIAPPRMKSPHFDRYEAIIPDLARRYGAKLEPSLLDGVLTRQDHLLPDGIHPNAQGARVMAERVAPLAAEVLEEARTAQREAA
jgi:acyl-CoA thioesterase I